MKAGTFNKKSFESLRYTEVEWHNVVLVNMSSPFLKKDSSLFRGILK